MRVLLLITRAEIGGAQSFVANLANGLKERGQQVLVVSGENSDYLFDFTKSNNLDFKIIGGLKRSFNPLRLIQFLFNFYFILKKYKPDVVHLNSSNSLLGSISVKLFNRNIKTIFTLHGLSVLDDNYKKNRFKRIIFRLYFKFCFKFIDNLIFVSQKNLNLAIAKKLVKRASLIYNGTNPFFIDRKTAREYIFSKLPITDNNLFLIGSIGRLEYPKNYEFLIENFDKILEINHNFKLILIGDGSEREKYQQIIKQKNIEDSVFLIGSIPDASKYLKAFDLFVLTSIYEGLSLSLIEARKACIQTIASDVGGNSEVIGRKNCYKLNNFNHFINIFKQKINTEQKNYTIKCSDNFSLSRMIEEYLKIYNN